MKQNILRGKILALLKKVYPNGVDEITIISVLYQYHKTEEITASLEYLVDKKYIILSEHPHPYLENDTLKGYKLHPDGIDLLEGNIKDDPGILIPKG